MLRKDMKKILSLGGTGAMGIYLTPELLKMGYKVDVVSLDEKVSDNANLRYIKTDAMSDDFLKDILKNDYDAIVDFLLYPNPKETFKNRMEMMLKSTKHYIYLSSYRVYAGEETPITENSPRLLDTITDPDFMAMKDTEYSLYKATGEDMLKASGYNNWSVVRPAVTYSSYRFQLVTLEAPVIIKRMREGKTVVLPKSAMNVYGTMSWAGDVAKMIALLILNEKAYGEAYTVSTAEHHTWGEIAEMYAEIGGLKYITVDNETYVRCCCNEVWYIHGMNQLKYDRLYDRIIDNSKILEVTGLKQSDLMPLKKGIETELAALPENYEWPHTISNELMDEYLRTNNF